MDSLTRDFQLDWACAGIAEASEASESAARARRNLRIEISGDEIHERLIFFILVPPVFIPIALFRYFPTGHIIGDIGPERCWEIGTVNIDPGIVKTF